MTCPAEAAARGFGTMGAVRGHLLLTNCLEDKLTRPNIELAMKEDRLLWLDLQGTDDEVLILLREVFKIHPLFVNPKESQLTALFALKRQLVMMRKLVTPQRDMVSTMMAQVVTIPGMTAESERYVRDLYDHLIRISDLVDSYRDLLSGSLDAYMSMVSNRLNDVMKQLTIIATVFLPLSFLTGFFGQNLGWLVNREGSLTAFLIFGIGTEALAVIILFVMFRRRGWLGKGS